MYVSSKSSFFTYKNGIFFQSPVNMFNFPPPPLSRRSTTTQPPASTAGTGDLFSLFSTTSSTSSVNNNEIMQPIQQTSFVSQQQQTNYLNSKPVSSISSPPATNLLGEFDLLGDFS
jgi:hypothetical protein